MDACKGADDVSAGDTSDEAFEHQSSAVGEIATESADSIETAAAPVHRMAESEKQVRRSSMLLRAHTMPVSRRRESVTAEDEDICAIRTRILSKMAHERGKSASPSPQSPAPVKFSRSRRTSVEESSDTNHFDGFFDLSLSPSVLINQIPVIDHGANSVNAPSMPEHDKVPQQRGAEKGPPIASRHRRFSCSMPASAMRTVSCRRPPM